MGGGKHKFGRDIAGASLHLASSEHRGMIQPPWDDTPAPRVLFSLVYRASGVCDSARHPGLKPEFRQFWKKAEALRSRSS
jgi:hypothetical protein